MKFSSRTFDYLIWVALGVALFVTIRRRSSGPEVGTPAASFNLPLVGTDGRFDLAKAHGKPIVVEVFASWCGTCRRATPVLSEAFRAHDPNRVEFVGVSVDDSPADAAQAKQQWNIPYAVALDDGSVARGYHVSLLPTVIVIGKDGTVRHSVAGMPSRSELDAWIAEE